MPDGAVQNNPTFDLANQVMQGLQSQDPAQRIRAEGMRDVLALLQLQQTSSKLNSTLAKEQPASQATAGAADNVDIALLSRLQQKGALTPQGGGIPGGGAALPPAAPGGALQGIPPELAAALGAFQGIA